MLHSELVKDRTSAHAMLMDGIYRHQRHIYDLTRRYYLLGRDRLIAELAPPLGGTILEVGCGTGRNLIAVAARYPETRLFGIDISAEMLKTARRAIERASLGEKIALAEGNALTFDPVSAFGQEMFDRVFFSYTVSMIPGWQAALAHALTMVAPEGRLSLVDFGQCGGLPRWFKRGLYGWLDLFHVSPRTDLEVYGRALAASRGARMEWLPLHRGYASMAHLVFP